MSRKLLDKNFCVLPWTGFELEPNGIVKPCIIAEDTIGYIHQNSIENILQSTKNIQVIVKVAIFKKKIEQKVLKI